MGVKLKSLVLPLLLFSDMEVTFMANDAVKEVSDVDLNRSALARGGGVVWLLLELLLPQAVSQSMADRTALNR